MALTKVTFAPVPLHSLDEVAATVYRWLGQTSTRSITVYSGELAISLTVVSRAERGRQEVRKYVYEFGQGGVNARREIPRPNQGLQEVVERADRPLEDELGGYDPTPEELAEAFKEEEEGVVPQ